VFGAFEAACLAEGEEKMKAIESAQESLAFLEKQIEGKKYFGGEEIGFLDLAAGWIPHWLNVMEEAGGMKLLDAEKFPSLHEWAQNFIQIPLIRECIPPRDKLLEYFNASISYMRSLATNQP
jgi:glutathione S-transferase